MPFKLSWLVPDHVILNEVTGDVTPQEVSRWIAEIAQMMTDAGSRHPGHVHGLFDQTHVLSMPSVIHVARAAEPLMALKNRGWLLLVTQNRLLRMINAVASHIGSNSMRAFDTLDDALDFLCEIDDYVAEYLRDERRQPTL